MSQNEAPTSAVSRAVQVLAALADQNQPIGVGALAEVLGLPQSTVHRLLKVLVEDGVVSHSTTTHSYSVGPELYRIAARTMNQIGLADVVQPALRGLADRFDETVLFGQYSPTGRSLAFLARADGQQLLQYRIALRTPTSLVWGASGKSVLAFLGHEIVTDILAYERTLPNEGRSSAESFELPERDVLEGELVAIRESGYAVSEGEKLPEARGIGVPVFGPGGVVGSLTLTCPKVRLPHAEVSAIAAELIAAAGELSGYLGMPSTGPASRRNAQINEEQQ